MLHPKQQTTEKQTRLWIGIVLIAGVLAVAGGQSGRAGETTRDYRIKYVAQTGYTERREEGLGTLKVMAYDSRTDTYTRVDEPFRDKIRVEWCNEWDFLPATLPPKNYSLPIAWSEVPGVKKLIDSVRSTLPANTIFEAGGGSWRACHPPTGIQAITGGIYSESESGSTDYTAFYGTYDQTSGDVSVVPTEVLVSTDRTYDNYYRPFFDADGEFLYVCRNGYATRYNVNTQQRDTITAGDVPVIPWNSKVVIVYDTDSSQFRLLDSDLNVRATVDGKLDGVVLSAIAVDDQTFIFGCTRIVWPEPRFGTMGRHTAQVTFELDFKSGTVTELFGNTSTITQLIDVEVLD